MSCAYPANMEDYFLLQALNNTDFSRDAPRKAYVQSTRAQLPPKVINAMAQEVDLKVIGGNEDEGEVPLTTQDSSGKDDSNDSEAMMKVKSGDVLRFSHIKKSKIIASKKQPESKPAGNRRFSHIVRNRNPYKSFNKPAGSHIVPNPHKVTPNPYAPFNKQSSREHIGTK
jgi:hypothetical protein